MSRANCIYRCGAVEIDATQRRVLMQGAPTKLGARAFDVLLALVERRERVVPKRELMDVVWPRLVVEENNLLVHMVSLRKLLGPQAIATIPGRGYRFVMPVDAVIPSGTTESIASIAAPARTTLAGTRGNLPISPALFGRAQDLDAVDVLLREHAVVTIVGAGGIGKTRLAMAAAEAAQLEEPGRTLVGRAGASQRGGADPKQHCRSTRSATAVGSAVAGSAGNGTHEPKAAAGAGQLRACRGRRRVTHRRLACASAVRAHPRDLAGISEMS